MTATEPLLRTALVYDFDGTLAKGNVQEHSFIPNVGLDKSSFWREVKRRTRAHDADEVLMYMWYMLERAQVSNVRITRGNLEDQGKATPVFNGLDTWFDRINAFGSEMGLDIQHFIISSGNEELIVGSSLAKHFSHIWASKCVFDEDGNAVWPGLAINYTNKTQYLFRINKGIDNSWDNEAVNRWIPAKSRPIPFSRMIFFGDGDTDIPAMKMVRHQGGYSVAVFDPSSFSDAKSQEKIYKLIAEDRVHYVAPADYAEGTQLDVVTRGVLSRIARDPS